MNRRWIRATVAAAAIALTGFALAPASHAANPVGRAPLNIGVAYGDTLPWKTDQQLGQALDIASRAGATWIRADLSWADIQPDRSTSYDWPRFDRIVAAAHARHLTVLPVIAYTPAWARPAGCTGFACGPADPRAFAAFANLAAKRYAPQGVHTWEVWNEENIGFWRPSPDPVAYGKLLTATSTAIRSADPRAAIVVGGLAATKTTRGHIAPTDFLATLAKTGALRAVNAIGYHPYTFPLLASTRTSFGTAWEHIDRTKVSLKSVLAHAGYGKLPIWVTEFGAPTGGPGGSSDGRGSTITPATTHVTEGRQAQTAADAVATAWSDPNIGALIWYAGQDHATTSPDTTENYFGFLRANGTAKPALAAFNTAVRRLPGHH